MTVVMYGRGLHQRMWRFQSCVDHFYVYYALKLVDRCETCLDTVYVGRVAP